MTFYHTFANTSSVQSMQEVEIAEHVMADTYYKHGEKIIQIQEDATQIATMKNPVLWLYY